MLALEEANQLLEGWAEWVLQRLDDGLGFARENTLGRIRRLGPVGAAIRSGCGPRTIPGNGTAERLDKAIAALSPCLKAALRRHRLIVGGNYGGN
jgi:hypothetical protein